MPSWSRLLVFGVTPVFFLACGDSNPVATPQVVMRIEVRAASSLTVIGGAFPVTATVFAQDGSLIVDRAVEWGTSNAAVAVVTSTGNLTARVDGKGIGPVTISAKLDGKSGFMPLTGTGPVPPAPPTLTPIAFLWSETEGFTTIPPLPGATVSIPAAINGAGTVVGAAYGTDQQGRLFIWSRARGTPIGLGLLPGSRNCFAWGINDAEVVVGTCYFQAGPPRAFRWSAAGGMREIPVPPGAVGNNAKSINSAGDVAGSILVASGSAVVSKPGRWNSAGVFEELKLPLPITSGEATGIDDAGNAVGWASQGGYYDPTGFLLWKRGSATETVIEMCTQSDCATFPRAMSRNGRVAGFRNSSAFSWTEAGGFIDYPPVAGAHFAVGAGINDLGQVIVNDYFSGPSQATLISAAGVRRSLGFLPGTTSTVAAAINNAGQVVGNGR